MTSKEAILVIYLVCEFMFCLTVLAGTYYAVFILGNSGWWFLLAAVFCLPNGAIIKYTTGINIYPREE